MKRKIFTTILVILAIPLVIQFCRGFVWGLKRSLNGESTTFKDAYQHFGG